MRLEDKVCLITGAGSGIGRATVSRDFPVVLVDDQGIPPVLSAEEHEIADTVEEWRKRIYPDDLDRALAAGRAYINGETDTYEIEYRLFLVPRKQAWRDILVASVLR